jgi:hypothetical protein
MCCSCCPALLCAYFFLFRPVCIFVSATCYQTRMSSSVTNLLRESPQTHHLPRVELLASAVVAACCHLLSLMPPSCSCSDRLLMLQTWLLRGWSEEMWCLSVCSKRNTHTLQETRGEVYETQVLALPRLPLSPTFGFHPLLPHLPFIPHLRSCRNMLDHVWDILCSKHHSPCTASRGATIKASRSRPRQLENDSDEAQQGLHNILLHSSQPPRVEDGNSTASGSG